MFTRPDENPAPGTVRDASASFPARSDDLLGQLTRGQKITMSHQYAAAMPGQPPVSRPIADCTVRTADFGAQSGAAPVDVDRGGGDAVGSDELRAVPGIADRYLVLRGSQRSSELRVTAEQRSDRSA